jgi:hypothetical protein
LKSLASSGTAIIQQVLDEQGSHLFTVNGIELPLIETQV